jgi:hypothetical protein
MCRLLKHGTQSIQLWIGSMPRLWRKEKTMSKPDEQLWFGTCPTPTDLVTDLPADFEVALVKE